jgi:hypothetical protein
MLWYVSSIEESVKCLHDDFIVTSVFVWCYIRPLQSATLCVEMLWFIVVLANHTLVLRL